MTTDFKNLDGSEKYADPYTTLEYEAYRQTYELPDWKDGERLLKRTPPRDYGTDRLADKHIYFDAGVMEREYDKIWSKVWLLAGHMNDLPRQNCFMKFDVGYESFLIVRGEGDQLHAMYNSCRHRGTELVEQDFGSTKKFVCPFHKWEFASDGSLLKIQDRETFRAEALCHDLNLKKVRVEAWRGWIFISMDTEAEPLEEFLGAEFMDSVASYDFEGAVRIRDVVQEWPANWKVAHEAFNEGYHVQATHPQLIPANNAYHCVHNLYGNGHALSIYQNMLPSPHVMNDIPSDGISDEQKIFLREAGIKEEDFPKNRDDVPMAVIKGKRAKTGGIDYARFTNSQLIDSWGIGLFPCTEGFLLPEGYFLQSWHPHPTDPEKCIYKTQVYAVTGAGELPSYMAVEGVDLSGKTVLPRTHAEKGDIDIVGPVIGQDVVLIPRVQRRMRSRGYDGAILSEQEIRIRDFYDEYNRLMNGPDRQ